MYTSEVQEEFKPQFPNFNNFVKNVYRYKDFGMMPYLLLFQTHTTTPGKREGKREFSLDSWITGIC